MTKKHLQGDPADKMARRDYEAELHKLQVELCYLQSWVKRTGARIVLVFEGRDAAGKGGLIKAITDRVSPRVFRIAALPAPSDREKSQLYMQRYIQHFPAAGEIVIFDRSWYNRAGVDYVMGFCEPEERDRFLELCPMVEKWMVESGIILIKTWLEVGMKEQDRRFKARVENPLRRWKLCPMDIEYYSRWYQYSLARDAMLAATDTAESPWNILDSNNKRRALLNVISHIISLITYDKPNDDQVKLPRRSKKGKYDDQIKPEGRSFVPQIW